MNHKTDDVMIASTLRLTRERLLELPFSESRRAALPRTDRAGRLPCYSAAGAPADLRPAMLKNLHFTAFPYPRYLRAGAELRERDYDIVHLENGRFSLKLVPGLGGRVLGLFDRALDAELLWQPPALRNAAVGLAGAWFVGGLEFNAFRLGHLAYGMSRLQTEEVELAGGWKGIRIGAADELFNAAWSATLVVLPDQVALRLRMENLGDAPVPGYWWTNIAVPANNRTKLFYHPGPALHHGVMRNQFIPETWPRLHGRDWSEWTEHHECISAYLANHGSDYIGHCDRGTGVGLAHRADRQICRGRKLWSVGAQYSNAVWMSRMSEPGIESYVELQSGRLPTQMEADLLEPGQVIEWSESLTGLAWNGSSGAEYDAAFASFEAAAAKAMKPSTPAVEDSANWRVLSAKTIVAEEERLAVSRTAVFFPDKIDRRMADKVCAHGWVAGQSWRRALARLAESKPLSPASELALAAADFDAGDLDSARRRLLPLTETDKPELRGWANLLLALLLRELKQDAVPHLCAAANDLAADADAAVLIHDQLFAAGRTDEADALWKRAPQAVRDTDAGRAARAQLAFVRGDYAETRALLTAPLLSIGENAFAAWTLWKEAHLAEALKHWQAGDAEAAARLLALAAEAAPQFSLGREESVECRDLLYYRWRLARERGQELMADTFAGWLRPARAFSSTADAAYLARFAAETGHPSAAERKRDIERWEAEAHDIDLWTFHPLHQAVVSVLRGQGREGWERLQQNWLYQPRAGFELATMTRPEAEARTVRRAQVETETNVSCSFGTMTPRQRWLALLAGKPTDRIPVDLTATPEVMARLLRELECADERALWQKLHVDGRVEVGPKWKLPHHPDDPQADMWGVRYQKISYGTGSYEEPCHHPLADAETVADIHRHRWPSADDFDFTVVTRAVEAEDGFYPIHGGWFEPFLFYGYLRGLEQAFEDLLVNPDIADAVLGHIFDFYYEYHRRLYEAGRGKIDTTWVAEDLGGQTGPLMSLETYRRFLLPNQIRMADLGRKYGVHIMYHTDGAARSFLPDLVDKVGIEVLNPIQWRCPGMEREALVRDFGGRIAFHGSIDNQQTLPFGTPEDVAAEVAESVKLYEGSRWICAPCHRLQTVSPTANILALYETIHSLADRRGDVLA